MQVLLLSLSKRNFINSEDVVFTEYYLRIKIHPSCLLAAQAMGFLTKKPGCCLVVSGPGVVHGLAGLANAQSNCW